MDFTAIKQLKLKEAFQQHPLFDAIHADEDYLNVLFECDDKGTLYIIDDPEKKMSVFIPDTKGVGRDKTFVVTNRDHSSVLLWHIDGVLFKDNTKCDCAIITRKELDFIEFKTNARGSSREAIISNYDKAFQQLLATIQEVTQRCASVGIDIHSVVKEVSAYAVFNRTVPRLTTMQQSQARKFLKATNGVKLHFMNHKTLL